MSSRRRTSGPVKPHQPKSSKSGIRDWINNNAEILKITFAIIAGVYAILEYKASDHLEHVKNSMDVIENFYKSDAYSAFVKLDNLILSDYNAELLRKLETKQLSSRHYRLLLSGKVENDHIDDIRKVARGFKSPAICAIQGRCHAPTICMYLFHPMEDFRCNFRETIRAISKVHGSCLIDEVNHLLDTHCKDWVRAYLGVSSYNDIRDHRCLYDKKTSFAMIGDYCLNSIIHKTRQTFFDRYVQY
jgi:hypothetical protein